MTKKFYITSAIPYVNAKPHIGHALEFVQADTIARYHRLLGEDVKLLSGGDENALKNVQAAEKAGEAIQEFVDKNNQLFVELNQKLKTSYDVWQKGSDQVKHYKASQKLWQLCDEKGDIYKKSYRGLYCVGCEAFYEREDLDENGECFEHPGKKLEEVEEENYFFKLSAYTEKIKELIKKDEIKIYPVERKNEILSFVEGGLKDISISRSNQRAKNWGVPVPGDPGQRIYVWFDALNIYQSGIGFGWNEEEYEKYWPADIHVIGKGIIRFHAVYWPAFLLSAGLKLPKELYVHGYYTVNGQKMSKTLGNVYDPVPLIEKYGADPLRYYMLAKTSPFFDGDFSEEKFTEVYNADLANGLGNLVARIAKLAELSEITTDILRLENYKLREEIQFSLDKYRFDEALLFIWEKIKAKDKQIELQKVWIDTKDKTHILVDLIEAVREIAFNLRPFLPETANKILNQFKGPKISSQEPLFPRIK